MPLLVVDVTELTVGITPSMTKALLLLKLFEAPGEANVRVAALLAASLIVPLFKANAEVEP